MNRIPSAMRQSVARSFFAYRHSDWRRASSLVAKMRIVSFVVVGLFATSARAQQTTGAKSASTQPATVKVPSANQEERTESTRAANVTDNMWKVSQMSPTTCGRYRPQRISRNRESTLSRLLRVLRAFSASIQFSTTRVKIISIFISPVRAHQRPYW